MKRFRSATCLLLVMLLVFSSLLFTGCGPGKKEVITLDVYSQLANYSGLQTGWFAKVLLDKFNVKINIINDADGVFVTRMESGDLGDIIIFGSDSGPYLEAIDKGMLYDWNEDDLLAKHGSYINEHMQKGLEKNISINPDGKLHGFGHSVAESPSDHGSTIYHPDVRFDLYKELGYPKVGTLEDWVDILAQMKEICPTSDAGKETYGVSLFTDWDGNMVMFVKSTGALYGMEEFGIGLYDVDTQTWQDCLAENSMYLRCLKFYNTLYQRGLLDPDSMTQQSSGSAEDYQSGGAFFNIFDFCGSLNYNTPEHLEAGKAMYAIAMEDQKTLMYGLNVYGGNRIWTIGASTQYPEVCMDIINWLSTPEGYMISLYGPKGLTWDYDENGKTYFTELGLRAKQDRDTEMTDGYTGTFGDGGNQMNNSTWNIDSPNPDSNGESYNYLNWASYNASQKYSILEDYRKFTGFSTQQEYLDSKSYSVVIGTSYSETKRSDEMELKWQQVSNAIRDYSWKAIYAANDEEYDRMVEEMKVQAANYGYEDVCQFYREEAARRKALEDEVKK